MGLTLIDLVLFLAAFAAGALNAVAGGGSFITFPAMVILGGMNSIVANATSTLALCPGSFAAMAAYRRDIKGIARQVHLPSFFGVSLTGGLLGAALLLHTPAQAFDTIVPWLLLFATCLFAFGKPLSEALRQRVRLGAFSLALIQGAIAIYGGYFGGGIGFLILASLSVFGLDDIHAMNGLKTLAAGALNAVATLTFITAGIIDWRVAAIMLPGALLGGYGGGALARRLPQAWLRRFILLTASGITAYFFWR
jgi:uncharacterized protein